MSEEEKKLIMDLGLQISHDATWSTCEKITNLFSNLANAIHYARKHALVDQKTLSEVIGQGVQHLQVVVSVPPEGGSKH